MSCMMVLKLIITEKLSTLQLSVLIDTVGNDEHTLKLIVNVHMDSLFCNSYCIQYWTGYI